MKVACLVIAYRGANVLRHSAGIFAAAGWDVFVHLDRKADKTAYLTALGAARQFCRFIEDPAEVFWAGFSMIQAEVKLIQAARQVASYDRYILISDDSVPIHSASVLRTLYQNDIDFIELLRQPIGSEFHGRYTGFFFLDHPATAARREGHRLLTELDDRFFNAMQEIIALREKGKKELAIYWGSQFWSLTAGTVEFMLKAMNADPDLLQSFKFSAIPDELLFQSIIGNRGNLQSIEACPMYADWFVEQGPRIYSSMDELPYDFLPSHAFLRKISPSAHQLIESIHTRLMDGRGLYRMRPQAALTDSFAVGAHGTTLAVVIMLAPEATRISGSWHPVEQAGLTRFRWTASSRVEWVLDTAIPPADLLRIVIPVIMTITPDFAEACELSFAGQTKRSQRRGRAIYADFEVRNEGAGRVSLTTPHPISPCQLTGSPDQRPLGLAIRLTDAVDNSRG